MGSNAGILTSVISLALSLLALTVSATTAWLTLLHRGKLLMPKPAQIYFGPELDTSSGNQALAKVYLRLLLCSTSKRGHIVESMYVRLQRGEARQNFSIWVCGVEDLTRGSGLFVPESGCAISHHFLLPPDGTTFQFLAGEYSLDIYATLLGTRAPQLLESVRLVITPDQSRELKELGNGLYFDWQPESGTYLSHVRRLPQAKLRDAFRELVS